MKIIQLLQESLPEKKLKISDYNIDKKTGKLWLRISEKIGDKVFDLGKAFYKEPEYPSEEEGEKSYQETGEYPRPKDQIVKLQGRKFVIGFIHDGDPFWVYEIED